MNNLRDEENKINVDILCVNACVDGHDAAVLVSNKQSFQCALLLEQFKQIVTSVTIHIILLSKKMNRRDR